MSPLRDATESAGLDAVIPLTPVRTLVTWLNSPVSTATR